MYDPRFDRLLDHVIPKAGFETIVETLLGHVVLAENIHQAIALFNQNGACRQIVTKNGDVITPDGIIIGGSRDRLNGILAKKQELKTLERQAHELEARAVDARRLQKNLEQEVRTLESDLQKRIERRQRVTQQEMEAEKDLYKAGEDLKNARRHLEIILLEQEQLMGEASEIDDEMSKYHRAWPKRSTPPRSGSAG